MDYLEVGNVRMTREEADALAARVREVFVGVFNDPDFLYKNHFSVGIDDYLVRELQKRGMANPPVVFSDSGRLFLDDLAEGVLLDLRGQVFGGSFSIRDEYEVHSARYFVTVPATKPTRTPVETR